MEQKVLTIFTRTPLHVGAGSSVGAIDQPIIRERHTRFPVIPGSSIKGVLRDLVQNQTNNAEASWLFGWDDCPYLKKTEKDSKKSLPGILLIGEARILAFPVRSAKGAFAWITCPLALSRFKRDIGAEFSISEIKRSSSCIASEDSIVKYSDKKIILEEYPLDLTEENLKSDLIAVLKRISADPVWSEEISKRLVIVSDEMFCYFVENACEIAQHIAIDNETGTTVQGAFFNQENVPSESLFYGIVTALSGKDPSQKEKKTDDAYCALNDALSLNDNLIQLGANETTGLGWCSIQLVERK